MENIENLKSLKIFYIQVDRFTRNTQIIKIVISLEIMRRMVKIMYNTMDIQNMPKTKNQIAIGRLLLLFRLMRS